MDVALIDSGVVGVAALDGAGKLVRGPDFSEDAGDQDLRGLDTFGHGTHMAGVITAADPETRLPRASRPARASSASRWPAPTASPASCACSWRSTGSAATATRDGLHIRVAQPLARRRPAPLLRARAARLRRRAAVAARRHRRRRRRQPGRRHGPARPARRRSVPDRRRRDRHAGHRRPADDTIADFSSRDAVRPPDFAAPGTGVVSLRVPGSTLDEEFPAARIGDGFFRGSGTSQATAVVSGLVALLLQARPELTPDQVKALLRGGAVGPGRRRSADGAGRVDLGALAGAGDAERGDAAQPFAPAVLDLDALWADLREESPRHRAGRGDRRERLDRPPLVGRRWSGRRWSGRRWSGSDWSAGWELSGTSGARARPSGCSSR